MALANANNAADEYNDISDLSIYVIDDEEETLEITVVPDPNENDENQEGKVKDPNSATMNTKLQKTPCK